MAEQTVPETNTDTLERIRQGRIEKADKLRGLGVNPYPYKFDISHRAVELHEKYAGLAEDAVTTDTVQVAGRIRAIRNSGMFIDLHDVTGKLQVFCHDDFLAEGQRAILDLLDIGDLIGVEGIIRRTKRGELTVNTVKLTVLSKSLMPLPDKFGGLTDQETRYRQRYIDLIMNEESRAVLRNRSLVIRTIRETLQERGFIEVETPMMQAIPGGAAARPFITHHNTYDIDLYLRIAPELYLKRLVVGGLAERVFEIGRNFRNEGVSPRHNPEFTMLEAYQAFTDYQGTIDIVEDVVSKACFAINGSYESQFDGTTLNFKGPWRRATMTDLVKEKTGVDFLAIHGDEAAREAAAKIGCDVTKADKWGHCVQKAFELKVEKTLMQPTHVIDQPRDISPFAKGHQHDPRLTERYETICMGKEIANAFSELSDPIDQMSRFEDQLKQREMGDDEAERIDADYVKALEYGLPPTGGLGIGIDRLVMMLTGSDNIRDVILFPMLRPTGAAEE